LIGTATYQNNNDEKKQQQQSPAKIKSINKTKISKHQHDNLKVSQ
jgi:hypothetical protein